VKFVVDTMSFFDSLSETDPNQIKMKEMTKVILQALNVVLCKLK
jgi:hypothetical protein